MDGWLAIAVPSALVIHLAGVGVTLARLAYVLLFAVILLIWLGGTP